MTPNRSLQGERRREADQEADRALRRRPRTIHGLGYGAFVVAGRTIKLPIEDEVAARSIEHFSPLR